MKKIIKNLTIILVFLTLVWIILTNSSTVNENVLLAFNLWIKKVFPSLFPMFVISDILINFGLAEYLGNIFSKITTKLFKVSGTSAYVLIMSILSGTPSNAIFIKELHSNNYLTDNEASKILSFTFFANPIFLYNFLNLILKYQTNIVIKVIFVCYISNIILGIILRNLYPNICYKTFVNKNQAKDFTNVLTNSIKKAMNNLIMILGTITFFIMLSGVINELSNFTPFNNTILKGILELTQGLDSLIILDTTIKIKAIIATIFICFGGLSIHMQIKSIINDTNISYKLFFTARIFQSIIAVIIITLIL